jgi:hypothetical protein
MDSLKKIDVSKIDLSKPNIIYDDVDTFYFYRNETDITFVLRKRIGIIDLFMVSREDKHLEDVIEYVPVTQNKYYCNTCKCYFHALLQEEEKTVIVRCLFCHAEVYDSRLNSEQHIRKAGAHKAVDIVELQLMKTIRKLNKEQPKRKTGICVICGKELPASKAWNKIYCSPLCRENARLIKDVELKEQLNQIKKKLRMGKYAYLDKESIFIRENEPLIEETKTPQYS